MINTISRDSLTWYEESHPKIHTKMNFLFQISCCNSTCLNAVVILYRNEAVMNNLIYLKKGHLRMMLWPQNSFINFHALLFPCPCSKDKPKLIVKMAFCFLHPAVHTSAWKPLLCIWILSASETIRDLKFGSGCCKKKHPWKNCKPPCNVSYACLMMELTKLDGILAN